MDRTIRRVFLGWQRPGLQAAVDWLTEHYTADSVCSLGQVLVVVPGARAGRRLREQLVIWADQQRIALYPPQITTVGQLPERLYRCRRPFASTLTQQLAWSEALRQTDAVVLHEFLQRVPSSADDPRWWELGTLLWRQHRELAADGLDFPHVAHAGAQLPGFIEQARWQALARVQQCYLRQLDQLGLWDRQTARLFAIEHRECRTDCDVVLLATVDINRALRQMLDQIAPRVTALVYADEALREAFDEYGCLRPRQWRDAEISLRDEQIRVAERPADQALEVVRWLAELGGRYAANEITVGVPDTTLVPLIEGRLAEAGVAARYGPGRNVEAARPVRLLRALVQYVASDRMADLVDVLRHPDLRHWLRTLSPHADSDVERLDDFCAERLAVTTREAVFEQDVASVAARRLIEQVGQLVAPLAGPPRPPADWVPEILAIVVAVYGNEERDPEEPGQRMVLGGCEQLYEALAELLRLPAPLSRPVSGCEAALMALAALGPAQVAAPPEPDAVELLGWLELPLDDAPVLVVTQMNEGTIPTSANSDLFLPDTLRAHLGLDDNARRYARDAYALQVLARTRQQLAVIVGRRDDQGNPLMPSRLLLATDDTGRIRRCLRLFGDAPQPSTDTTETNSASAPQPMPTAHGFEVPRPRPVARIDTLNVTDFRAYLECPYRFYLSRLLGLQSVTRGAAELDGGEFGVLMHEVLECFGESAARESSDAEEIQQQLAQTLERLCRERFGPAAPPAVRIQLAQMRLRLDAFAQRQAAWRAAGWRIVMTEGERRTVTTDWPVDDQPFRLKGRIDRIDQHEHTGRYAILDYKSSEQGRPPHSVHLAGAGRGPIQPEHWRDLQLPLYRHLAVQLGLPVDSQLGFVLLPRNLEDTGFALADWTEQELATADEAARRVVRKIRQGEFWAPAELGRGFDAGLDRICQVGVFARKLAAEGTAT